MLLFRAVPTAKLTRVLKDLEQRSTVDALKREIDASKIAFRTWANLRLEDHPLAPVTTGERALAVVAQSAGKGVKAPPPPGTRWPGWGGEAGMEGKSRLMNLVDVTEKYVDASNDLSEYKKPNEPLSNRVLRTKLYEHLSTIWADGAMTVKTLRRKQKVRVLYDRYIIPCASSSQFDSSFPLLRTIIFDQLLIDHYSLEGWDAAAI